MNNVSFYDEVQKNSLHLEQHQKKYEEVEKI